MTSKTENLPLLLNVQQVAALLGCHKNTIWNRVRTGSIPSPIKWEGKTVWKLKEIEVFVDQLAA
ncbi:helix-turn-helix transcriptional regulator [Aliiroseovarius sp. YM-037]|uniref:helix-turn-helix transcriptional regulator n=1 Tax=Aliiroseovarius sp. YM-037 TaxID=3341728 RepID=UPI003A7F663C